MKEVQRGGGADMGTSGETEAHKEFEMHNELETQIEPKHQKPPGQPRDRNRQYQTAQNQSGPDQTESNRTGMNQIGSTQNGSTQSGLTQSRSTQSGLNQSGPSQIGPTQTGHRRSHTSRRDPAGRTADNRKAKIRTIAFLLLAVCCMAGAGTGVYLSRSSPAPEPPSGLVYEANVVSGDIPGKSTEERQRELDSMVEEGMLAMSMNITPSGSVTGEDRSINWMIENPSNQGKLIRVEITRDDTGELIFETGAIRPGNYLESAPLKTPLPAGEYPCTAAFLAYQEDTEAMIGQAAVKIKLVLQEGREGKTSEPNQ